MYFDFLIPKRPVSLQTRKTANLQAWKQYVRNEAAKIWTEKIFSGKDLQLTLIYLYNSDPVIQTTLSNQYRMHLLDLFTMMIY